MVWVPLGVTEDLISTRRAEQPGSFHHHSWEQNSQGGQRAPPADAGHFPGMRLGRGWAQPSMAHRPWLGRAGLWEAAIQPPAASWLQGWWPWGTGVGFCDVGRMSRRSLESWALYLGSWTVSNLWAFELRFGFCSSAESSHKDRCRITNSIITHTTFSKERMDMWAMCTDSRQPSFSRK